MSARLNALRAKQGEIHDQMEALLTKASNDNDRALSPEEDQVFKDLEVTFKDGKIAIEREEKVEAIKASLAKPLNLPGSEQTKTPAQAKFRYGTLKAFKNAEDAYPMGMFLRATVFGDQKAFGWCDEHGVPVIRAQGETVGTTGGYLVPVLLNQAIIDLRETYGTLRQALRPIPMGSDSITMPRRAGGVSAYWTAENTAITESSKSWGQVDTDRQEAGCLTRTSTELAEDAIISIADDLAAEMAYSFAQAEDAAAGTATARRPTAASSASAPRWSRSSAPASSPVRWMRRPVTTPSPRSTRAISRTSWRSCRSTPSRTPSGTLAAGLGAGVPAACRGAGGVTMSELTGGKPQRSYLGYPVMIDQTCRRPRPISAIRHDRLRRLGLATTMGERRGITIKTSASGTSSTTRSRSQATERVDINVHDVGDSTTAGPLVALSASNHGSPHPRRPHSDIASQRGRVLTLKAATGEAIEIERTADQVAALLTELAAIEPPITPEEKEGSVAQPTAKTRSKKHA
jgi:hypothetical protein